MTTEVQIKKNRRYLPQLCKIISCLAAKLGMSWKDIADTEDAVSEICSSSIDRINAESEGNLFIKLTVYGTCMTVEITDPCLEFGSIRSGKEYQNEYRQNLEWNRLMELADSVELIHGGEGTTIRITKRAERPQPELTLEEQRHLSPSAETANLHA